jgi:hypothetical protein
MSRYEINIGKHRKIAVFREKVSGFIRRNNCSHIKNWNKEKSGSYKKS